MAEAKIVWIKPQDGGKKKIPPVGMMFYPMIKINTDEEIINWSLVLINKEFNDAYETTAEMKFLMDNAPHFLLKSGIEFTLYEGAKKIAKGKIK